MLSRVAERLYWMARYQERAENTARLVSACANLIMDLPKDEGIEWEVLIQIFDAEEIFASRSRALNEQNIVRFLISDKKNPASLLSSITSMRENVRTTRDVMPSEIWENTNELFLYASENADRASARKNRYAFLEEVVSRCQQINGLLLTTLSRDHAYKFIKLGHLLERADMTTRIIDVGVAATLDQDDKTSSYSPLIWRAILHSLSSITSYRQYIGPVIEPVSAVNFVFKESAHPRSVIYCLRGIQEELEHLPNSTVSTIEANKTIDELTAFTISENKLAKLHQMIQKIQGRLSNMSEIMTENWFSRTTDY